jgi:hypothetical protein
MGKHRVGGLGKGVDPAVARWQEKAHTNPAALTAKQKRDRARTRARYDVPQIIKESVEAAAEDPDIDTSASQFAAFLLAFALVEYYRGNETIQRMLYEGLTITRSMNFSRDLDIPSEWLEFLEGGAVDGAA